MEKIEIKSGDKYGRLTIIKEIEPHVYHSGQKQRRVLCRCGCEKSNIVEVRLSDLRSKKTTSCGCIRKEKLIERSTAHDLTNHPLYKVWQGIKTRCYNSNVARYKDWGGRGVFVCKEWLEDFKCFYDWAMANGYKKGLQIDRTDNDRGYSPTNCRFVTASENVCNQRIRKTNTSGYRNVYYHKRDKRWYASVGIYNKRHSIGYYSTAEEAAKAYNEYIIANKLPNKLNII